MIPNIDAQIPHYIFLSSIDETLKMFSNIPSSYFLVERIFPFPSHRVYAQTFPVSTSWPFSKRIRIKSRAEPEREKNFIDFSASYLSIFFITYDLLDGIRRDYNNKAVSFNWRNENVSPSFTSRDFTYISLGGLAIKPHRGTHHVFTATTKAL